MRPVSVSVSVSVSVAVTGQPKPGRAKLAETHKVMAIFQITPNGHLSSAIIYEPTGKDERGTLALAAESLTVEQNKRLTTRIRCQRRQNQPHLGPANNVKPASSAPALNLATRYPSPRHICTGFQLDPDSRRTATWAGPPRTPRTCRCRQLHRMVTPSPWNASVRGRRLPSSDMGPDEPTHRTSSQRRAARHHPKPSIKLAMRLRDWEPRVGTTTRRARFWRMVGGKRRTRRMGCSYELIMSPMGEKHVRKPRTYKTWRPI